MDKRDVAENKKRYTKDRNNFTRIAGAYVNSERAIVSSFAASPLEMEEEELGRYLDLAKKSLSGKFGNNILMLPFTEEEMSIPDVSVSLKRLKDSGLKDESLLNSFYHMVIDSYECTGNYLIVLFADTYDVPSRSKDNASLDESEYVFDYILCSICPVALSTPSLGYRLDKECIGVLMQEWTAAPVETAFMYPAFSDRMADTDCCMVYSKKPAEPHQEFWENGLHLRPHMSDAQKMITFKDMVAKAVDPERDAEEQLFNVADYLSAYIEERKDEYGEEGVTDITADDVENVLSDAGFEDSKVQKLVSEYKDTFSRSVDSPTAETLLDSKLLKNQKLYHEKQALEREVQRLNGSTAKDSEDGLISITLPENDSADVSLAEVNGSRCIVIPVDDDSSVKVNGKLLK